MLQLKQRLIGPGNVFPALFQSSIEGVCVNCILGFLFSANRSDTWSGLLALWPICSDLLGVQRRYSPDIGCNKWGFQRLYINNTNDNTTIAVSLSKDFTISLTNLNGCSCYHV
ncbi:hypothetical protein XENOCAPTIV_022528 [Xenoophorus captivus]|uniref:Uncharacterized protein n=1 Tax=Xenoophorus captivus TaxID=1517983 RepID=A0ABV0RSU1_9TELE